MNVRIWIGPAGSGKTTGCLTALRDCERRGERALWIVPDQFTYAADRLLLADADLPGTRFVRVASFRRCAHLAALRWQATAPLLSPEGQRLLLRGIVHRLAPDELGPLARVRQAPGFAAALAASLREIKGIAGAEAAARLRSAGGADAKAAALGRIIAAYDEALAAAGLTDPDEWIQQIARQLRSDPGPWAGQHIWVDGFMSLTPGEKTLLEALAEVSGEVVLTLCVDARDARVALQRAAEAAPRGISATAERFCQELRLRLRRPQFLPALRTLLWADSRFTGRYATEALPRTPRFSAAPQLARLERVLFAQDASSPAAAGAPEHTITYRRFASPHSEVTGWARRIDAWTRLTDAPLRYREIAVLVRDLEGYRPLIREIFARYGIPLFLDQRRDVAAHPLLRLVLGVLRMAAQGWARPVVIAVLRNPLLALDNEALDRIDNLSLEYGIEYQRWWETDWELFALPERETPLGDADQATGEDGFAPDEDGEDARAIDAAAPESAPVVQDLRGAARKAPRDARMLRRLQAAPEAREIAARLFPALREFTDPWRAGALPITAAAAGLRRLLATLLPQWPTKLSDPPLPQWSDSEHRRIAELLEETLQQAERLISDVPVSAALMSRLLRDALGHASIGLVPQSLDAVIVAEPRRSRVNEARRVIFGGLDAGAFPHAHPDDPLLTDAERARWAEWDLPLASPANVQTEEEAYLFYVAATRATESLHLTCAAHGADGRPQEPSPYLLDLLRQMGIADDGPAIDPRDPAAVIRDCHHPQELAGAVGHTLQSLDESEAAALSDALRATLASAEAIAVTEQAARSVARLRSPSDTQLGPDLTAEAFPGGVLTASASRLEKFSRCPFQHFAQYWLRLERRPEAKLSPLSTGAATHAALERFFRHAHRSLDVADAEREIGRIFADLSREEEFRAFQEDPPSAYRWQRTARHLRLFVRSELQRLQASVFRPVATEMSFGLEPPSGDREAIRAALESAEQQPSLALPPLELSIPGPQGVWTVRLRGRIDRVDLATGEAARARVIVIDYKQSDRRTRVTEDLARGIRLQVATYLLAIREILGLEPVGAFYYSVRPQPRVKGQKVSESNPLQFKMSGIYEPTEADAIDPQGGILRRSRSAPADDSIAAALEITRAQIIALSRGILAGRIAPEPLEVSRRLPCEYCDYRDVCRFDRLRHPIRSADSAPAPDEAAAESAHAGTENEA